MTGTAPLKKLVAAKLDGEVPDALASIGEDIRRRHGASVVAVLAYGSCLRGVDVADSLADIYLLVSSYRSFHRSRVAAVANQLLPPNVYYHESTYRGSAVRAKYAVVSLRQFHSWMSRRTSNPYFWARFAQPVRLLHAADANSREQVIDALAEAVDTAVWHGRALADDPEDGEALWEALFRATYASELRSEGSARAGQIVGNDADHYRALAAACEGQVVSGRRGSWAMRRFAGKMLSVLRLIKAAFTFTGGPDYLAWKIARHSGLAITLKPWQRRHPILASIVLLPQLYFKGGVR